MQKLQYRGERNSVKNGLNKLDCPRKLAYVGFHVNYRETEGLVSYKKASSRQNFGFLITSTRSQSTVAAVCFGTMSSMKYTQSVTTPLQNACKQSLCLFAKTRMET